MKRKLAVSTLIILSFVFMPIFLNLNPVSAQSSGYTIQNVDHTVEVMFSGHTVIRDEITISGSVTNGFQIGIPSKYASSVLKVVAFDGNRAYTVDLVSQLGGQSGFYVAQVDFEDQNPQFFTVEFVLSNSLISEYAVGYYTLDYPAYPALTTTASQCQVTLSLPTDSSTIYIDKSDGVINSTTYSKISLPAFTNVEAAASFDQPTGLLQLVNISTLTRQITIAPSGVVSCTDNYLINNVDMASLSSFLLSLPSEAENVVARESLGGVLSTQTLGAAGSILLVNVSFSSYLATGQLVKLIAEYTLPSVTQNSCNFTLFPAFNYFVDTATFTVSLPEGASFTTSDSSAVITTDGFEQQLTVTRQNVTYVDYQLPGYDFIQIDYSYNPLWASFRPTIIVFALSVIGCLGLVFVRKHNTQTALVSSQKTSKAKTKHATTKVVPVNVLTVTPDLVYKFIATYEERTELSNELKALELKMKKGKLPRSQYKNQKHATDARIEGLTRSITKSKEIFRNSNPEFADLIRQLNLAETDLSKAEARLNYLETQKSNGQITIEVYKNAVGDLEEAKETAQGAIDEILLRLREKMQ
jgi:hypothetical protein